MITKKELMIRLCYLEDDLEAVCDDCTERLEALEKKVKELEKSKRSKA